MTDTVAIYTVPQPTDIAVLALNVNSAGVGLLVVQHAEPPHAIIAKRHTEPDEGEDECLDWAGDALDRAGIVKTGHRVAGENGWIIEGAPMLTVAS